MANTIHKELSLKKFIKDPWTAESSFIIKTKGKRSSLKKELKERLYFVPTSVFHSVVRGSIHGLKGISSAPITLTRSCLIHLPFKPAKKLGQKISPHFTFSNNFLKIYRSFLLIFTSPIQAFVGLLSPKVLCKTLSSFNLFENNPERSQANFNLLVSHLRDLKQFQLSSINDQDLTQANTKVNHLYQELVRERRTFIEFLGEANFSSFFSDVEAVKTKIGQEIERRKTEKASGTTSEIKDEPKNPSPDNRAVPENPAVNNPQPVQKADENLSQIKRNAQEKDGVQRIQEQERVAKVRQEENISKASHPAVSSSGLAIVPFVDRRPPSPKYHKIFEKTGLFSNHKNSRAGQKNDFFWDKFNPLSLAIISYILEREILFPSNRRLISHGQENEPLSRHEEPSRMQEKEKESSVPYEEISSKEQETEKVFAESSLGLNPHPLQFQGLDQSQDLAKSREEIFSSKEKEKEKNPAEPSGGLNLHPLQFQSLDQSQDLGKSFQFIENDGNSIGPDFLSEQLSLINERLNKISAQLHLAADLDQEIETLKKYLEECFLAFYEFYRSSKDHKEKEICKTQILEFKKILENQILKNSGYHSSNGFERFEKNIQHALVDCDDFYDLCSRLSRESFLEYLCKKANTLFPQDPEAEREKFSTLVNLLREANAKWTNDKSKDSLDDLFNLEVSTLNSIASYIPFLKSSTEYESYCQFLDRLRTLLQDANFDQNPRKGRIFNLINSFYTANLFPYAKKLIPDIIKQGLNGLNPTEDDGKIRVEYSKNVKTYKDSQSALLHLDLESQMRAIHKAHPSNKESRFITMLRRMGSESNLPGLPVFDPVFQGNIPFALGYFSFKEKKPIQLIRMSTPTQGESVTPEFIAFVKSLKKANRSHLYISLQKRSGKEGERNRALYELSQKFPGTFKLVILDKDSEFYMQKNKEPENAIEFMKQFRALMVDGFGKFSEGRPFYFPPELQTVNAELLKSLLLFVHQLFGKKPELSQSERKTFITVYYAFLEIVLMKELNVQSANISCKDAIDRAGEGNSVLYQLFNVLSPLENQEEYLLNLAVITHFPAWSAKKQPIIEGHGRRERLILATNFLQKREVKEIIRRERGTFLRKLLNLDTRFPFTVGPIERKQDNLSSQCLTS